MTKIELNVDQETEVVVNSLVWDLDYILDNPWDYAHSYVQAFNLMSSLCWVIEHYTTQKEAREIYTKERIDKVTDLMIKAIKEVSSEELQNTKG